MLNESIPTSDIPSTKKTLVFFVSVPNVLLLFFAGADKLRLAERQAKEKKVRLWEDYQSNAQIFTGKEKDFTGTVIEVFNGDSISVKTTAGAVKKVFIASIRPPREATG